MYLLGIYSMHTIYVAYIHTMYLAWIIFILDICLIYTYVCSMHTCLHVCAHAYLHTNTRMHIHI